MAKCGNTLERPHGNHYRHRIASAYADVDKKLPVARRNSIARKLTPTLLTDLSLLQYTTWATALK